MYIHRIDIKWYIMMQMCIRDRFINDTDCFYYSFTTREGKKYYYVNPKKKEKCLLFDTDELLSKIAVYTKKAYSSADPHLSFTFMEDNETIRIDFDSGLYAYNIHTKELKQLDEKPTYKTGDPYWMKYSPDSLYFLYASKDNLYFCLLYTSGGGRAMKKIATFSFKHSELTPTTDAMWDAAWNIIANCNNLAQQVENGRVFASIFE